MCAPIAHECLSPFSFVFVPIDVVFVDVVFVDVVFVDVVFVDVVFVIVVAYVCRYFLQELKTQQGDPHEFGQVFVAIVSLSGANLFIVMPALDLCLPTPACCISNILHHISVLNLTCKVFFLNLGGKKIICGCNC